MAAAEANKKLSNPVVGSMMQATAKAAVVRSPRIANTALDLWRPGQLPAPIFVPKPFHLVYRNLFGTMSPNLVSGAMVRRGRRNLLIAARRTKWKALWFRQSVDGTDSTLVMIRSTNCRGVLTASASSLVRTIPNRSSSEQIKSSASGPSVRPKPKSSNRAMHGLCSVFCFMCSMILPGIPKPKRLKDRSPDQPD